MRKPNKNNRKKLIRRQKAVEQKKYKRRKKKRLAQAGNSFHNSHQKQLKFKSQNPIKTPQQPQGTYTEADMVVLAGFTTIYPEQTKPDLTTLLKDISREDLIKIAMVLVNLYNNAQIDHMSKFFPKKKIAFYKDACNRFHQFRTPGKNYVFCVLQTAMELLKVAFSIPYHQKVTKEGLEEDIFKAMLIINEKIMELKPDYSKGKTLERMAQLLVVNSFSQKDINDFDYFDVYREVFSKCMDLFEYVSTDPYFMPIYQRFLTDLNINDYKEYLHTIMGLFFIIKDQGAGTFEYDPYRDADKLIKLSVLDYIAMPLNQDVTLKENEDYRAFRNKPLIKLSDGSYEIINTRFVLERLYASLYFDFRDIAKELKLKNYEDNFKQAFMEKTLLCKYIDLANKDNRYYSLSSKEILSDAKKGEDGEPDYYLHSNNSVILFENKDIMINGAVKESRDLDKIIAEYKNKLLLKTYNSSGPVKTPKPEGIGQLVRQIKKIQTGNAFWHKTVAKDSIIYPVLVLSDAKLMPEGLPYLMEKWRQEQCVKDNVKMQNVKPLIVLSITTLLLYAEEFRKNGYEYYFEQYYKSIRDSEKCKSGNVLLDFTNASVSFSDFMKKVYPKDFYKIYESYKNRLFSDTGSKQKQDV